MSLRPRFSCGIPRYLRLRLATALGVGCGAFGLGRAAEALETYSMVWRSSQPAKVDLGDARPRPAGQGGYIAIRDGHLARPDGTRFRIWGVNLTGGTCFPEKANAPFVARYLARLGVNAVRLHFMDSPWGEGRSLFRATGLTTREFAPEQLDRLDFLVAELIRAGIHLDFNLNVGRTHREGDGVRDHETLGFGKGATLFSDRLIELQKEYARQLLTHRNPYTGRAYQEEPAVLAVEIVNENSLVEAWFNGRLQGTGEVPPRNATWRDIPASYAGELDQKYQQWIRARLTPEERRALETAAGVAPGAPVPRLRLAEFKAASESRFRPEARFILETECAFYVGMEDWLRRELGLKCVVVANSDHAHHRSSYATLSNLARLAVVDGHVYWSLNERQVDQATGRPWPPFRGDRSLVSDPEYSTAVQLARSAVEGKPFIVSETNHLVPPFESEGIPIVSSYAALQDWDGIFFYTFEHEEPGVWDTAVPNTHLLNLAMDPVKIPQLAAYGIIFKRGDLRPAPTCVVRGYEEAQIVESIRGGPTLGPFYTEGFSPFLPLMQRTRIRSFTQKIADFPAVTDTRRLRAETGELLWHNEGRNFVELAVPRAEALVGYVGGRPELLRHCEFRVENTFAALTCVALDEQPIARSGRLLLVAAGRCELTGEQWSGDGLKRVQRGRKPTRIEVIRGELTLKGLAQARQVRVEPLDGAGNPLKASLVTVENGVARIRLGEDVTTWFLLTVVR